MDDYNNGTPRSNPEAGINTFDARKPPVRRVSKPHPKEAIEQNGQQRDDCNLDLDQMRQAIPSLISPDQTHQIQVLPSATHRKVTRSGDNIDAVISVAKGLASSRSVEACYLTLNPTKQGLDSKSAVRAEDIAFRQMFLMDFDRTQKVNQHASDDEKAAIWAVVCRVKAAFESAGWPEPGIFDTGNGCHVFYRINLPNDEDSKWLVNAILKRLKDDFGTDKVEVDQKVGSANKSTRIPGTWNRKYDEQPGRPHRQVRLVQLPTPDRIVTVDQLTAYAPPRPPKTERKQFKISVTRHSDQDQAKVQKYALAGIEREREKLLSTSEGGRNDQLNRSAMAIGQLLQAAGMTCDHAEAMLIADAESLGLSEIEARGTVRSGLKKGISEPRDLSDVGEKARRFRPDLKQANGAGNDNGDSLKPTMAAMPSESFCNFELVETKPEEGEKESKTVALALPCPAICNNLLNMTGGWPKALGNMLFVQDQKFRPQFLTCSASLMAFIRMQANVGWKKGSTYTPKDEFLKALPSVCESYDAIESFPHEPPISGIYYMHQPIPAYEALGLLDKVLDFFNPYSLVDREFIRAFIFSLFWGGAPGSRPGWLITSAENAINGGRGDGKTTVPTVLAEELVGGFLDLTRELDVEEIKTRLLSPEGSFCRVALLDNLKTHRFSDGDLEGLITKQKIDGKRMYHGRAERPNTIVWVITMVHPSLSKDMAQRFGIIKMARPDHRPGWLDELRTFIRSNKPALIAEILHALKCPVEGVQTRTRWADWEASVLAATQMPQETIDEFHRRQSTVDSDDAERDDFADCLKRRLKEEGHDPDTCYVFIPSDTALNWYRIHDPKAGQGRTSALRHIIGLSIPELIFKKTEDAQGFRWRGLKSEDKVSLVRLTKRPDSF